MSAERNKDAERMEVDGRYDGEVVGRYMQNLSQINVPESSFFLDSERISVNHTGMEHKFDPLKMTNGLYFAADFIEKIYGPVDGEVPDRIGFTPDKKRLMRLGKEDSARKVFFGEMSLSWGGGVRAEIVAPVAVKPFVTSTYRAYNEFAMTNYVRELGFDTFMPVMIHKEPNAVYLITLYDPSVATFDNAPWHHIDSNEQEYKVLGDQLNTCANHLAKLHANMVLHRDPQIKNIGHRENTGFDVAIDLETAISIRDAELSDSLVQSFFVAEHIFFFNSLLRAGYMKNPDEQVERYMYFLKYFIDRYESLLFSEAPQYARSFFEKGMETVRDEILDLSTAAQEGRSVDLMEDAGVFSRGRNEMRTIYL